VTSRRFSWHRRCGEVSGLQREAAESVSRKASGVTQVVDNIGIDKWQIRRLYGYA
jgi:hypothetical protein